MNPELCSATNIGLINFVLLAFALKMPYYEVEVETEEKDYEVEAVN